MSRRRDPAPVKKSSPLSGTTIGSLYGEAIGVKPGVFIGLPSMNPTNLQKSKMSVPTGVQVNKTTNNFDVELVQSGAGKDQTALNLRFPEGYERLPNRALIRISVLWMRGATDRETVLNYVMDKVLHNMDSNIRDNYEEDVSAIVHNQNCGSGWSSSAHLFLIGKNSTVPPLVDFSKAGNAIFMVNEGEKFNFDGNDWMWKTYPEIKTAQHQKLKITLVGSEAMDVDAVGAT